MAKTKKSLSAERPDWLTKIHGENVNAANKAFMAMCEFVQCKLDFESMIDSINDKYGSHYKISDIFSITQEQEQQALDMLEGADDDE